MAASFFFSDASRKTHRTDRDINHTDNMGCTDQIDHIDRLDKIDNTDRIDHIDPIPVVRVSCVHQFHFPAQVGGGRFYPLLFPVLS